MLGSPAQTSIQTLAKCEISIPFTKKISAKHNKVQPMDTNEMEEIHRNSQISAKIMVNINPSCYLNQSVPSQLEKLLHIRPIYSLGVFLKDIQFRGSSSDLYILRKLSSFPFSTFQFIQNSQKMRSFLLVANFTGSKYNLLLKGQSIFTIAFEANCGMSGKNRNFQIFGLMEGLLYGSLEGSQNGGDLSELYNVGQNSKRIIKLFNQIPHINSNGTYGLKFAKAKVIPSVNNSIITDFQNKQLIQMYQVDQKQQLFQICYSLSVPTEWCLSIALACLDFKLAIQ